MLEQGMSVACWCCETRGTENLDLRHFVVSVMQI
jgi:hypothetical protein